MRYVLLCRVRTISVIWQRRYASAIALCVAFATLLLLRLEIIVFSERVILVLACCAVIFFAWAGESFVPRLFDRLRHFLGNATYAVYLTHFPIQIAAVMIVDMLGLSRSIFFNPLLFVTYLLVTVVVGLTTYQCFERPAQDWIRSRWRESNKLTSAQPTSV